MDEPSAAVPLVSVVVPTFGDAEGLGRCLAALELQTYPADRYEVVVVDNGSRPAVVLPESRRARRLEIEPKPGSYAARNRGVRSSRGEIFAFTDADCAPRADWLEQGVAALGIDPAVHPVAGRIELTFAAPNARSAAELYEEVTNYRQQRYVERYRFGATANLFMARSAFERIGPFDESLQSGGDVDWGRRADAAGLTVRYAEGAVVRHPARRSLGELRRRHLRVVAGMWRLEPSRLRKTSLIVRLLLPPLRPLAELVRTKRVQRASDLPRLAAVLTYLRWVESGERLRLALGGRPRGWRAPSP